MLLVVGGDVTAAQDENAPALDLRISSLAYGDVPIVDQLNLTVTRGETLALIGPSGIGKTSILRIIGGLETGFQGSCVVNGKTAMIFQEPTLLPWRSVRDNICVTTGIDERHADIALEEVGLTGRGSDYPSQLSLGQQRRLSLARAFATQPDLLLMDEPFVSLDPALVDDMMQLFVRLRATHHVTTILVTHVEAEAKALASRIVTLGGQPASIVGDVQNTGAYFQLSASGVTSSRS